MKKAGSNSFLRGIPSWVQAVLTFVGATIVLLVVGESAQDSNVVGYLAYILYILLIASGCFFIISTNPKSVWYVPFICNATSIIAAFVEPNFWRTPLWIPNCAAWLLTIIVTYFAWRMGKRKAYKVTT